MGGLWLDYLATSGRKLSTKGVSMSQITAGVRGILSYPLIYSAFQSLMGAHRSRWSFVTNYVKPSPRNENSRCWLRPSDILDLSSRCRILGVRHQRGLYHAGQDKFGQRGRFSCKQLQFGDLAALPKFDVVLALGLLHHLDDPVATGRPATGS